MRIAFVLCGDLASVSGGFLYDRQLIAGLRADGVTVDVVTLPWWRGYPRALAANLAPWPFDLAGYDVIVQDHLCHAGVLARNRRLRRGGAKLVSLVHNLSSTQPRTRGRRFVRACERAYFRSLDGVIAVCAGTLSDVRAVAGKVLPALIALPGRDHVDPLPLGLALARVRATGPLRLLFVGVLAPHKGLHRLLPVLADLAAGEVRLDVAGSTAADPAYVRQVRATMARLRLEERVHLHGQCNPERLAVLRAEAHVLVMPSDREAYPLAALEGLAAGLPVLLTNSGGTADLIGDSGAGQLIAPDDTSAWQTAIAALVRDRARLLVQAPAALARHAAHGTWSETAARVRLWLESLR
jgi:glycosyltransferase involved in cell wall biosynthesis